MDKKEEIELEQEEIELEPADGNFATVNTAYYLCDSAFVFPITPSTPMSEQADLWVAQRRNTIFGIPLSMKQMQAEYGSAAALHGCASLGGIGTTFTASQGLLLMLPNMIKLAGELLPAVIHIASRSVAGEALSIFGDHSDLYMVRGCGFAFLGSSSPQECAHMSIVAHVATLQSRVPFGHFFDGFRTSHAIEKISLPTDNQLARCVDWGAIQNQRDRALSSESPVQRGSAQSGDVFFQMNEANNPFYAKVPEVVEGMFDVVQKVFGPKYSIFEYFGASDATDVIVAMCSAADVVQETIEYCNRNHGNKVGLVKVRLYRPFCASRFNNALPSTVQRICCLDRGKDPQSVGEPLFMDVCGALKEINKYNPLVIGGRYGLSSKDFTPDMVLAVMKNLALPSAKNHFTVGIIDDVTHTSLSMDETIETVPKGTVQCQFWGIGGDGTVGANKAAVKLICSYTDLHAQAYFAYDANKAGGYTVSHLRFGKTKFNSPYLIYNADYVACHNPTYVNRFDMLRTLRPGGTFVLNCIMNSVADLENGLPPSLLKALAKKRAKFYVIDATKVAIEAGLGTFVNMILQSAFFRLSGVLEVEKALELLKNSIRKMYSRKGDVVINKNLAAVDQSLDKLIEISVPDSWASLQDAPLPEEGIILSDDANLNKFYSDCFLPVARYAGDDVPVSKFLPGGQLPAATSQFTKRGIAQTVPHWHKETCVQCNRCAYVCPHAVIRSYFIDDDEMKIAPENFGTLDSRLAKGHKFRIQVSDLDCTGCALCAEMCPAKCLEMTPIAKEYFTQRDNIVFARKSVKPKPKLGNKNSVMGLGAIPPTFEFPGSCGGCGETPYVRIISQLFGERMVIAAATGCNTIWGGSYPLVPYAVNDRGEGPAWHNSLFEDGGEFGIGMVVTYTQRRRYLAELVKRIVDGDIQSKGPSSLISLLKDWLENRHDYEKSRALRDKITPFFENKDTVLKYDPLLQKAGEPDNLKLLARTSFWIFGGDGFASDIGFGGLDHVIGSIEDVTIFIMDTEVYSNTGGQSSKCSNISVQAKLAMGGRETPKKDLGRMFMTWETAYVASIAMGYNMEHTIKTLKEAEAFCGPSFVIAYTPCTEHHIIGGMKEQLKCQKLAVETGYWINYRFNPEMIKLGKNPFFLDSKQPSKNPVEYLNIQGRFVALAKEFPEHSKDLQDQLSRFLTTRYERYSRLTAFYEPKIALSVAPSKVSKMPNLLILWASEGGNSEDVAAILVTEAAKKGFNVKKFVLDEYEFEKLPMVTDLVVIVHSSNMEGIPSNGQKFWKWLKSPSLAKDCLSEVVFALFGLGDSTYPKFQWAPLFTYNRFLELGARNFCERGVADDSGDGWEVAVRLWMPKMLAAAEGRLGGRPVAAVSETPVPDTVVKDVAAAPRIEKTVDATEITQAVATSVVDKPLDAASAKKAAVDAAGLANQQGSSFIQVAHSVYWVGAVDFNIRDFHGIDTEQGSSYNSYLIMGPCPTLVDTVKAPFWPSLKKNIEALIDPLLIRYVVINHAEQDHSSSLGGVMDTCKNAIIICNSKCRSTLEKIYHSSRFFTKSMNLHAPNNINTSEADSSKWKFHIVDDCSKFVLADEEGYHQTLWFMNTPMVHWPESMFTYLIEERVLFSMDGFGQHLATRERFDDELVDCGHSGYSAGRLTLQDLIESSRSYYANILLLFGAPIKKTIQKLLLHLPEVDVKLEPGESKYPRVLATAHGIIWRKHVSKILGLYLRWADHTCLPKVLIMYGTMYGSTEKMARSMYQGVLEYAGEDSSRLIDVRLINVSSTHITVIANEALDSQCIAVGSCSLNNEVLPPMAAALTYIKGLKPSGRSGIVFGSYGWSPVMSKALQKTMDEMKIQTLANPIVCNYNPDDAVLEKCRQTGLELAAVAFQKGVDFIV